MEPRYFVDTWFFIASLDRRDSHHRHAVRLNNLLGNASLVTTEAILAEVIAFFADGDRHSREAAARAVRKAMQRLEVISVGRPLFERALDLYEARLEKEYSLVDCMSMVVMRERDITHVLTNDHHFRQEGFVVLTDVQ